MKECTLCKEVKPFEDFPKRSNRKHGYQSRCRLCLNKAKRESYNPGESRGRDLKYLYNIDLKDYDSLLKSQNNSCAICKTNIEDINHKHKKHLCVDHCHKSNEIRGLLCDSCNRALGMFGDDVDILQEAYKYLTN